MFEISGFRDRETRALGGGEAKEISHRRPVDPFAQSRRELEGEAACLEQALERVATRRDFAVLDARDRSLGDASPFGERLLTQTRGTTSAPDEGGGSVHEQILN